jgi:hypothetical protein
VAAIVSRASLERLREETGRPGRSARFRMLFEVDVSGLDTMGALARYRRRG